jgi:hypothetical protein
MNREGSKGRKAPAPGDTAKAATARGNLFQELVAIWLDFP